MTVQRVGGSLTPNQTGACLMKTGSCLCNAVTYRVDGPLRPILACHCTQCQKTSGHHVAATAARREHVSIEGEVTWFTSSDTARRGFCALCGSNLFWDGQRGNMSIFAGTLDDKSGLQMAGHIYCADKAAYYEINDDLPKADGWDSSLSDMLNS